MREPNVDAVHGMEHGAWAWACQPVIFQSPGAHLFAFGNIATAQLHPKVALSRSTLPVNGRLMPPVSRPKRRVPCRKASDGLSTGEERTLYGLQSRLVGVVRIARPRGER